MKNMQSGFEGLRVRLDGRQAGGVETLEAQGDKELG